MRSCRVSKRSPSVGRSLLNLYANVKQPEEDSDHDDFSLRNESEGDLSGMRETEERRSSDHSSDAPRLRRSSALDSVQSAMDLLQASADPASPGVSYPVVTVTEELHEPTLRRHRVLAPGRDFVAKRRLQDGSVVTSKVVRNIGRQAPSLDFNPATLLN